MICVTNTVYIDVGVKKVGDKVYPRYLLRESYWENGRSRQRTIANVSDCPLEDINAMRLALKYKGNISDIIIDSGEIHTEQGLSVGAVFSLYKVAQELGIVKALGNTEKAKRALWMIISDIFPLYFSASLMAFISSSGQSDMFAMVLCLLLPFSQ